MNTGKGFKRYCERVKAEKPVCRCGFIGKIERYYGRCFSKGEDGNCYLKTGVDCKYAKELKGRNFK